MFYSILQVSTIAFATQVSMRMTLVIPECVKSVPRDIFVLAILLLFSANLIFGHLEVYFPALVWSVLSIAEPSPIQLVVQANVNVSKEPKELMILIAHYVCPVNINLPGLLEV